MSPLRLAWLSVLRHPGASLTLMLCLALALAAGSMGRTVVAATARAAEGLTPTFDAVMGPKSESLAMALEAFALREPSEDVVPYAMLEKVKRRLSPRHLTSLHVFARHRGAPVVAVDESWIERPDSEQRPKLVAGRLATAFGEATLGVDAAARLGLAVGDRFTVQASPSRALVASARARVPDLTFDDRYDAAPAPFEGEAVARPLWRAELEVVGLIAHAAGTHPAFDDAIFTARSVGYAYYARTYEEQLVRKVSERGAATYILVQLASESAWPALSAYVHDGSTIQLVRAEEETAALMRLAEGGRTGAAALSLLVLALTVLGIGVVLNARFDVLKGRLGLLRALGYGRGQVAQWLTAEGLLLVLPAVALAAALERGALWAFAVPDRLGVPVAWPEPAALALWGAAPLAVLVAVALPLVRLYRADVRAALNGL